MVRKDRRKPHWASSHPLYSRWCNMISRCYNPHNRQYEHYGGRGIIVCDEWRHDFWQYATDVGSPPERKFDFSPKYSLDRIDVNGDYEPSNIRWANGNIQGLNKRISPNNTSGYKGVSWSKAMNKWHAYISYGGRTNLGYYKTAREAASAYNEFARKHYPHVELNELD